MTDGLVDKVAQLLCETGNVTGFKCCCPDPVDGWCLGGRLQQQSRAAIAAVYEAQAKELADLHIIRDSELRSIATAEAALAKAREEFRNYAQHTIDCAAKSGRKCDCGLPEAYAAIGEEKE